jgi:hypothetical protein
MAEQFVNPILELFADVVLEPFSLLMHIVPREPHRFDEIEFEQPVVSNDFECHPLTGPGQLDALVRGVSDESLLGEPTHHLADSGRADAEPNSKVLSGDVAGVTPSLVDRFYIVFDRGGSHKDY